jgi:hypothetical protein
MTKKTIMIMMIVMGLAAYEQLPFSVINEMNGRRESPRKSLITKFTIRWTEIGKYWTENETCTCFSAQMESKVLTNHTCA